MRNVNTIIRLLQQYEVIAMPTDSIYGLSCLVNFKAVSRLISIKKRSITKGFIIISGKMEQLLTFVDKKKLTTSQIKKISIVYEKPTTWVVPTRIKTSWLTGNSSKIAIRLTTCPLILKLTTKLNQAIISSSVNISGQAPITTEQEIKRSFRAQLKYVHPQIQKIPSKHSKPSQIIDLMSEVILRK